jgi:hypothetical protein
VQLICRGSSSEASLFVRGARHWGAVFSAERRLRTRCSLSDSPRARRPEGCGAWLHLQRGPRTNWTRGGRTSVSTSATLAPAAAPAGAWHPRRPAGQRLTLALRSAVGGLHLTSSARMQNGARWVKNSKRSFCNHRVALVETLRSRHHSSAAGNYEVIPHAIQQACTGSLHGDIIMIQTSRFAASPRNLPIVSATS